VVGVTDIPTSQEDYDVDETTVEIVAALDRPRRGAADPAHGGMIDPGTLPSFGEEYEDCGEQKVKQFCPDCGGSVNLGRNCERSQCPHCSPFWSVDKSENQLARLQTTARKMSCRLGPGDERVSIKKHHVTFSPPEDWFLEAADPLDRTFSAVNEALEPMHAEGTVMFHGYRGTDGDDRDAWKNRLYNDRTWRDVRSELRPSGHFHGILLSPWIPGGEITKRVEAETGWVIERIRGLPTIEAVAESLTYGLSHTSLYEQNGQMQAQYRQFGSIMNDDFNIYPQTEREAERAVRSVAPRVLGVKPNNLRCSQPVPDEDHQSDYQIRRSASYSSSSGSDDSDGDEDGDTTDGDSPETSDEFSSESGSGDDAADRSTMPDDGPMCRGTLRPISEAPRFLSDDDWIADALFSEQLQREFDEWQGDSHLDRPPPVAEVWAD
jgi:hypothetical protein